MNIKASNLGKRYNAHWIFRRLDYNFDVKKKYAITGPNGSGKSTLLQTIGGFILHNEGSLDYQIGNATINPEKVYRHISFAAPYLELIEEMTLLEFFSFHQKMRGWIPSVAQQTIIESVGLEAAAGKQIRYFSSGMKQRVKLAQAIFSNTEILLLDEPLTNLDKAGAEIYYNLIDTYSNNRLVIVSSNEEKEYSFCDDIIHIPDFK